MDHSELRQQIRVTTKMALAIDMTQLVREDDAPVFAIRARRPQYMRVWLNGWDLYDIEVFEIDRRTFEKIPAGTEDGLYADQVNDAMLRLAGVKS